MRLDNLGWMNHGEKFRETFMILNLSQIFKMSVSYKKFVGNLRPNSILQKEQRSYRIFRTEQEANFSQW